MYSSTTLEGLAKSGWEKPPKAQFFCDLVAAARSAKIKGHWSGSIYRHHPCGLVRGRFILCNEWNVNNYCYASVMERPDQGIIAPANHPASWGRDPHPHPKEGDEFFIYRNGRWHGEDGPWRNDLWRLLETIEVELADLSLAAEWQRAVKHCDDARAKRQLADRRLGYYV